MLFTVEEYATREEWLCARVGIGGSASGAILGHSKKHSPYSMFQRMTGRLDDDPVGEAAEWGHRLESAVMEKLREVAISDALKCSEFYHAQGFTIRRSVERPHLFATVDGLCKSDLFGLGIVEAKTCNEYLSDEWSDGKIPERYRAQCEHYLAVLGEEYRFALIGCLIGGQRFVFRIIERDESRISKHIKRMEHFWNCVESDDPSELIDGHLATAKALEQLHRSSENGAETIDLTCDAEATELLSEYRAACVSLKGAQETKRALENQLKSKIGSNTKAIVGWNTIRWKEQTATRLDSKKIRVERPEIFEEFKKVSTSRKFTVKWCEA